MEWLAATEFQYNDNKQAVTGRIPLELNFGRHSWEEAKKPIEIAREAMKRQFDKKRRNTQGLKTGDNVWLKAKNIHLNRSSKKLNQKRYGPFKILKNIGQGAFQLELPEG